MVVELPLELTCACMPVGKIKYVAVVGSATLADTCNAGDVITRALTSNNPSRFIVNTSPRIKVNNAGNFLFRRGGVEIAIKTQEPLALFPVALGSWIVVSQSASAFNLLR
jgi:hypothetical protein